MKLEIIESKKQAFREILQTIGVPVVCWIFFVLWIYGLIRPEIPSLLLFPLGSIIIVVLYFISGSIYSGVSLLLLTAVGFIGIVITDDKFARLIYFLECSWFWMLFLMLERYQNKYLENINRMREQEDVMDTKNTLYQSKIEENRTRRNNLHQQIANYQMLGKVIQMLETTLHEEKIVTMIVEIAAKFIGKGFWKIKFGTSNDVFAKYVAENEVALIVSDISSDDRFSVKSPRFASLIAVPLEVNDKYWGILVGTSEKPGGFDENDLRLLSIVGSIASLALNNAALYKKTQELSITDSLTGLYVQKYFKERLTEEILRSQKHNLPLSVAIMDVDHFKFFNDAYGHQAGDAVLRQISALLHRRLRETDLLSRYGGEEFGVIMLHTDIKEAQAVCEQIRKVVAQERFYLPVESFQPVQVRLTISIGLAGLNAKTTEKNALLKKADDALYDAKNRGRNKTMVAEE